MQNSLYVLCFLRLGELKRAKQLIFTVLSCNLESYKVQYSLYLLCFLQFGELTSAKQLIFTVLSAIWRDKKCKIAYIYCAFGNLESQKVQNSLYLLCCLQLGELKSAKQFILAVIFAIWRAKKFKTAYIYCAFYNSPCTNRRFARDSSTSADTWTGPADVLYF